MLRRKTCSLVINRIRTKKHVLIKDFNRFLYDNLLHCERKYFCLYCLHDFITEKYSKHHIKDCFKINGNQTIKMSKKGQYVEFRNFERKIN